MSAVSGGSLSIGFCEQKNKLGMKAVETRHWQNRNFNMQDNSSTHVSKLSTSPSCPLQTTT